MSKILIFHWFFPNFHLKIWFLQLRCSISLYSNKKFSEISSFELKIVEKSISHDFLCQLHSFCLFLNRIGQLSSFSSKISLIFEKSKKFFFLNSLFELCFAKKLRFSSISLSIQVFSLSCNRVFRVKLLNFFGFHFPLKSTCVLLRKFAKNLSAKNFLCTFLCAGIIQNSCSLFHSSRFSFRPSRLFSKRLAHILFFRTVGTFYEKEEKPHGEKIISVFSGFLQRSVPHTDE